MTSRRPPKDPVLALAYQLAVEAAERDFKAAHPHLKDLLDAIPSIERPIPSPQDKLRVRPIRRTTFGKNRR